MPTLANIGYLTFDMGSTGSPIAWSTHIEEVNDVSNVGFENDSIDVTNFDSAAGYKEFIGALKEGVDVTIRVNHRLASNTGQLAFITAQKAGINRYFRLGYVGGSPLQYIKFIGAMRGVKYLPSQTDRNQIEFTVKISGDLF